MLQYYNAQPAAAVHEGGWPLATSSCRPFVATCRTKPRLKRRSATAAALQETVVEFRNHRGEKLVGTLVDPPPQDSTGNAASSSTPTDINATSSSSSNASGSRPVVLLAHGYMSSRNSELLVRLSTALARNAQLSSFRCDFSGNGESEGEFRYGQYR